MMLFAAILLVVNVGDVRAQGNVGIGTVSPDASALLDLTTVSKGLLPPRMTQSQRDGITAPATGLFVFCTDSLTPLKPATYYYYNGSSWVPFEGNYISNYLSSVSSGVLYGPASQQNSLTAGATPLFNVAYAGASGASVTDAGALIAADASGATAGSATGLTVSAIGSGTGTTSALSLSSSGGTTNMDVTGTSSNWSVTNGGSLTLGKTSTKTGSAQFANSGSANLTTIQAGNATAAVTYTLPTAAPTSSGQVLASTTGGTLSWVSNNGTASSYGATAASFIAKTPTDFATTASTALPVPGLSFPIAAGGVYSFRAEIYEGSSFQNNGNAGCYVGISVPSGGTIIAMAEGLADLGANGHEIFKKITGSCPTGTALPGTVWNGKLVGSFNDVTGNDTASGLLIYGTVDNTNGVAGSVQLEFAATGGDSQIVYHNSFVTAWQYTVTTQFDQIYTSTPTAIVVPSGITTIYVSGYGGSGGGGGGGAKTASFSGGAGGGGSGGAGEYISTTALAVHGGETLTITIGTAGTVGSGGTSAGASATDGGTGGNTTISGSVSGLIFTANGGSGGTHAANASSSNGAGGAGGAGGSASSTPPGVVGNTGATGNGGSTSVAAAVAGAAGPGNANIGGNGGTGFGSAAATGNGGAGTVGAKGYLELSY